MSETAAASWVLGDSLADTFRILHDLGVSLMELSAGAEPPNPDLRDPAQVEWVAGLAAQWGIGLYAIHTEFRFNWNLASPDPDTRRFALEANATVIRAAAGLGARHVVLHPGQELTPGEPAPVQLQRSLDSLRTLAPVAAEAGILLAVENLPPGQVCSSLSDMAWLLAALDPAVFGFCCDTGHAAVAGEGPAAFIRAFAPRLLGIHLHDNVRESGEDDHRFPGLGDINWAECFAALREMDYTLPITVEALPPPDLPLAQAAAIIRDCVRELQPPVLPPS